ncbi:MAG: hypothetical protein JXA14_10390 [Anaerolineae bacterium]|nr:hypothetical protein [Anaerolineae bacterium]
MALTKFPIEVTEPTVDVVLPVGTHVLELVVEDSAGLKSAPAAVVVTVKKEVAEPLIKGIVPKVGKQGATLEAAITGENLKGATAVEFFRIGAERLEVLREGGVVAEVKEATANRVVVGIKIDAAAEPGAYNFRVTTPAGTAQSPLGVAFTVEEAAAAGPVITGIDPKSGEQGAALEAVITGENLKGATAVEFFFAEIGLRDESVVAEIKEATANQVVVGIRIDAAAKPGMRQFAVATPAGTAQSPVGVTFTVKEAAAPGPMIEGIVPASGEQGEKLAVIYGASLEGAKAVTFLWKEEPDKAVVGEVRGGKETLLTMLAAGMLDLTADELKAVESALDKFDVLVISIRIEPTATSGARSFTVTTPAGTVQSPRDVTFTVEAGGIVPIRTVEEVSGIGPASATRLAEAGVTDLGELAAAEPVYVAEKLGVSEERATDFVKGAKRLLGVPEVELSGRSVQEVSGIGATLAARLAKNGITDLAEVAAMETSVLSKVLETTEARASEYVKEAQRLLG